MKDKPWSLSGHSLRILKFFLLLALAGGLLFLAFRGVRIATIIRDVGQANLFWVSGSALFSVAALVARAYRWNLLIEPLGYSPSLKNTTSSLMVAALSAKVNLFPSARCSEP